MLAIATTFRPRFARFALPPCANRNAGLCFSIGQPIDCPEPNASLGGPPMSVERHVRLFRNGRNQAVRIPREFELAGDEATMRREGDRLIIEPLVRQGLLSVLATLKPLRETFADPDHGLLPVEEVKL